MELGGSWEVEVGLCLNCGHKFDHAGSVKEQKPPEPGDGCLCIACSHIMVFDENLRLREATPAELDALAADDDVVKTAIALKRMRDEMGEFGG
jgi:hypothetical protein